MKCVPFNFVDRILKMRLTQLCQKCVRCHTAEVKNGHVRFRGPFRYGAGGLTVQRVGVHQDPVQIEEQPLDHSSFMVPEAMRRPLDRSKSITLLPVISSGCLLPMVNRVLPKTTPVRRKSPMRTLTVDSMPVGMAP